MNILVLNCGSSSVKYQVLDVGSEESLLKGKLERVGDMGGPSFDDALKTVLGEVASFGVTAVGHRVVHGGAKFTDAVLIDGDVEAHIAKLSDLAPLHNPVNLAGIRAARRALPDIPHVAVFDTAFHASLPRRARTYAMDMELAESHGIRRFGFHGPSHAFVSRTAADFLGNDLGHLRLISLHLGSGASACAIEHGRSVETSMGMTPLEGLVMGSRSGDLDPGVVLALVEKIGAQEVDALLNKGSGLAGISGIGKDLRDIENQAAEGNDRARLAISVFAHRASKYIGAYAAVMGGVDAVILTGGIGENSAQMRHRILERLDFMGLRMDEDKNRDAKKSEASVVDISDETSRVKSLVVRTNEELMIAREAAKLVGGAFNVKTPNPIPIAVSARHVHLNRAGMDALFGKGSELTPYKPLSQPGQFASEERVTLVGPRGKLERVRVLGPLRGKCQVEVSRTDEFSLGVDAPIRASGRVEGSAPITLEGPKGTLHLPEGLICAWRHIHMTTADAEAYGVKHGDEVEVAVTGGPRDLVFGDVMVRVKDSYALEMHIDTDEANAAELNTGAKGALVDEVYVSPEGDVSAQLRKRRPA